MNEITEKVARALCVADGHDPDGPTADVYVPDDPVAHMPWAGYRSAASAAINAMPDTFTGPWVAETAEDGTVTITDVGETDLGISFKIAAEDVKRLFGK